MFSLWLYLGLSLQLILIITTLCLIFVYIYFKNVYNYWKKRNIDYLEPYFVYGNLKHIFYKRKHITDVLQELYEKIKGPYAGVYFCNQPALMVKDPELIKHILVKDFNHFVDRGVHSQEHDPLSLHLFRISGQKWRNLRIKLSPIFTSGKIKGMFPLIVQSGSLLQNALNKACETNEIVDVKDLSSRFTIDVIVSIAFGIDSSSFSEQHSAMKNFIQKATRANKSYTLGVKKSFSVLAPEILEFLKQSSYSKEVVNFMFDIVQTVMDYRFTNKVNRNDFMQLLIQLKNTGVVNDDEEEFGNVNDIYVKNNSDEALTFTDLVAQAYVFIVAGNETSAVTMSNCLYELAKNPDIQKRVQKEIDDILLKYDGNLTYEAIKDMEYLSMTVSETLRKYPPLSFLNRITTEDYKIPNSNVIIEKNTKIIISVSGLQKDPKYYPDPEKFDPERFNQKNKESPVPFTYVPFGDGPRHCIGMRFGRLQTMIGLVMCLRKYNFDVCSETPYNLTLIPGQVISVCKEDINLSITERNTQ